MIYKTLWNLTGTDAQQALVKNLLDTVNFPWEEIKPPMGTISIDWASLNGTIVTGVEDDLSVLNTDPAELPVVNEGIAVTTLGVRRLNLGVFYPSGAIVLDNQLEKRPIALRTTLFTEVANVIDYFLPVTEAEKTEIIRLMGGSSWANYTQSPANYGIIGEAFIKHYFSSFSFNLSVFKHKLTGAQAVSIWNIVVPAIATTTTTTTKAPVPTTTTTTTKVVSYPYFASNGSKFFHDNHTGQKKDILFVSRQEAINRGFLPCKKCKP